MRPQFEASTLKVKFMDNHNTYLRSTTLPVPAADAFAWHEREGALERLIPPWERVKVRHRTGGLEPGARVELINHLGPLPLRWLAEHTYLDSGREFRDVQLSGPFAHWEHAHRFAPVAASQTVLEDEVSYTIPGGRIGKALGESFIRDKIERMFRYRHATTVGDLETHAVYKDHKRLHVAITGTSGLVGSALAPLLTTGGHRVTRLVRRQASTGEVSWYPRTGLYPSDLQDVDAVVHLAGENIAGSRWTKRVKQRIRDSRVEGTRNLCESLARSTNRPKTLICASAIGFYGDGADTILDESSPSGDGFLAEVAREWEAATRPAQDAGIRVVHLRLGVVLSPQGGALKQMLTPFRMGIGGRIGSGKQYWSWISIDDAAGTILHALMTDSLVGPVNAVSPQPLTNRDFTATLGNVLRRPTILPMPSGAARLALGEMADELLLASLRVRPAQLLDSGYHFRHPDLETTLRHVLGK